MMDIEFSAFISALARPAYVPQPADKQRLTIATRPDPFVAPTLVGADHAIGLNAEVIFVEASAAVGKSTMARYVSATLGIPILDLSRVPVSTGSLRTLLLDMDGRDRDPVAAFHSGNLPIIVDALDEGRLLSGETGFESFIETTGELLLQNRNSITRPKLIFFGRFESTDLAKTLFELAAPGVKTLSVNVGFFNREGAWELIDANAQASATSDSAYLRHKEPVRQLIQAYFDAIEGALGLKPGELWTTEQGRAFAGYAPVLAAVGSLLSQMENYIEIANRLRVFGAKEAWGVIESVLNEILEREQVKLCDKLRLQISKPLPSVVYGAEEQMALLSQYVGGQQLEGSGKVSLSSSDTLKYQAMVQQYIPEHPFIRQKDFGNPVLGSVVLAQALSAGKYISWDAERLSNLSRQPFIWRSLSYRITSDALIEGSRTGYIFNSFWSDPITQSPDNIIHIRPSQEDGAARVYIPVGSYRSIDFSAILPITFHGRIKDCNIDIPGSVILDGSGARGGARSLFVTGDVTVICGKAEVNSDNVRFDGTVWMEANEISAPAHLRLHVNGAKVGWGGQFAQQFPWNRTPPTLEAPYQTVDGDRLAILLRECSRRMPDGITIALNVNLSPAPDDPHMRWVARQFAQDFPGLIRLMIQHGLASSEPMRASGEAKVRIRFAEKWVAVCDAASTPEIHPTLQKFISEARSQISPRHPRAQTG